LSPIEAKQRELKNAIDESSGIFHQANPIEQSISANAESKRLPLEKITALQKKRTAPAEDKLMKAKIERLRLELTNLKNLPGRNTVKSEQLKKIDYAIEIENRKIQGLSTLLTLRRNFSLFWLGLTKIVDDYEKTKPAFQSRSTRAFFQKLAVARACVPSCEVYAHMKDWYTREEKNTRFSFDVVHGIIQELIDQEDSKEDQNLVTKLQQLLLNSNIEQHAFKIEYDFFYRREFYLQLQKRPNSEAAVRKYLDIIVNGDSDRLVNNVSSFIGRFNLDTTENKAYHAAKTEFVRQFSAKAHDPRNTTIEAEFYKQAKLFMDALQPLRDMPDMDMKFQVTLWEKARNLLEHPWARDHQENFRALLEFISMDKSSFYTKLKAVGMAFLGIAVIVGAAFISLFPVQMSVGLAGAGLMAYSVKLFQYPTVLKAAENMIAKAEKLTI
jgi:hypothetical protein